MLCRARALSLVMTYAVVVCAAFYTRLLFLTFTTVRAVVVAVIQRAGVHVLLEALVLTKW